MQMTKRLICTVIVFALMVCCLASCDLFGSTDPLELVDEADQYLEENAYSMTISVTYSSEDEALKDAIKKMGKITMDIKVDGESFELVDTSNGDTVTYTLVDGILYLADGAGETDEIEFTDDTKEALIELCGGGVMLTTDDFETHETSEPNDKTLVVCTDLVDDTLDSMVADLADQFEEYGIEATVAIKDAKLSVQVADGKHDVTMFECLYFITVGEESYSLNMTYHAKYNYDDVVITAPDAE